MHRKLSTPLTMQTFYPVLAPFRRLSRSLGQVTSRVTHPFATVLHRKGFTVRLACVKHAASVRPEPGSNSP